MHGPKNEQSLGLPASVRPDSTNSAPAATPKTRAAERSVAPAGASTRVSAEPEPTTRTAFEVTNGAYVPGRTWTVSPGCAASSADWTSVNGAPEPGGPTSRVAVNTGRARVSVTGTSLRSGSVRARGAAHCPRSARAPPGAGSTSAQPNSSSNAVSMMGG